MLTLHDALQRISTSTALNEGPDAACLFDGSVSRVTDLLGQRLPCSGPVYAIKRVMRNWAILDARTNDRVVTVHPWDATTNVATLGASKASPGIQAAHEFCSRLDNLTGEASRIGLLGPALTLSQLSVQLREHLGMPTQNARAVMDQLEAEVRRLRA